MRGVTLQPFLDGDAAHFLLSLITYIHLPM